VHISSASGVGFRWHFNVAVWFFSLTPNGKEPPFDFFQDCGIVVNHAAVETNLNWGVGHQQIFTLAAIEILNSPFFIPVTAAEITLNFPHRLSSMSGSLRVSQNSPIALLQNCAFEKQVTEAIMKIA
jgi:hypothetical protein